MEDVAESSSFALFDLVGGRPIPVESQGQAQTLQVVIRAALASLVFAAAYGAAVGVTEPSQALRNLVSLPVVVLLAVGCALPPALLSWKVAGHGTPLVDLFVSLVTGVFTATLVLACAAPLLALYYLTTAYVGAPLAMVTVTAALVVGVGNAFRAAMMRRSALAAKRAC